MNEDTVVSLFNKYFYFSRVNSSESLELVYKIRYEVFCEELQFFQAQEYLEKDQYDDHSDFCLLIHKETNNPAGCIRLILPPDKTPDFSLPFEHFCSPSALLDIGHKEPVKGSFGEFSRIAVPCHFRRRENDEKKPLSLPEENFSSTIGRRSSFPFIPVGLFMGGMSLFLKSGLNYGFAMMEPRLPVMMQRFGIFFIQIGQAVDYYGLRAPFVLIREDAVNNLAPEARAILKIANHTLLNK